jgi:hypothetical protein
MTISKKLAVQLASVALFVGVMLSYSTVLNAKALVAPLTGPPPVDEGPPGCTDLPPSSAPQLYQIDAKNNKATLYFSPAGNPVSYYYVAYGYKGQEELFVVKFANKYKGGAISYSVNHLLPNTTYYFKVRGGNMCKVGPWSNSLSAKTGKNRTYTWWETLWNKVRGQ